MILTAAMTEGRICRWTLPVSSPIAMRRESVWDLRYTLIAVGQRAWLKVRRKTGRNRPHSRRPLRWLPFPNVQG
jgi:hypothetical protein